MNEEKFDNRLLCQHKEAIGKLLIKQECWSNVKYHVQIMQEQNKNVSLTQSQFQSAIDMPVKNCKWVTQMEDCKTEFGSLVRECRKEAFEYFKINEETSLFKAISTILANLLVIPAKYSQDSKLEEALKEEREKVKQFVVPALKKKCCLACSQSKTPVFMYTHKEWFNFVNNISDLCNSFILEVREKTL